MMNDDDYKQIKLTVLLRNPFVIWFQIMLHARRLRVDESEEFQKTDLSSSTLRKNKRPGTINDEQLLDFQLEKSRLVLVFASNTQDFKIELRKTRNKLSETIKHERSLKCLSFRLLILTASWTINFYRPSQIRENKLICSASFDYFCVLFRLHPKHFPSIKWRWQIR